MGDQPDNTAFAAQPLAHVPPRVPVGAGPVRNARTRVLAGALHIPQRTRVTTAAQHQRERRQLSPHYILYSMISQFFMYSLLFVRVRKKLA